MPSAIFQDQLTHTHTQDTEKCCHGVRAAVVQLAVLVSESVAPHGGLVCLLTGPDQVLEVTLLEVVLTVSDGELCILQLQTVAFQ